MKINRALLSGPVLCSALTLMLSSCATPTVVPRTPAQRPAPRPAARPAPQPAPAPRPAPAPATTPLPPASTRTSDDWRDAPQTVGTWRYVGGTARFGPGEATLFALTCNRAGGAIELVRTGTSPAPLPMTVVTTSTTRPLSADPDPGGGPRLVARLAVRDALLDAMAFSRGRFAVEVNGLPTLYLPAWAEIGRVIEDCRR